jgi:pyruvate/2-oxoglutarate dehydrogenase complex dihydrolipoamide acyltransferase (E2) component
MKVNLKLARIGMNMQEATIVKWHKQAGEEFRKGEVLYEIETEKVTQEVEAQGDGRMLEILVPEETDAKVGQELCVVDVDV